MVAEDLVPSRFLTLPVLVSGKSHKTEYFKYGTDRVFLPKHLSRSGFCNSFATKGDERSLSPTVCEPIDWARW